MPRGRKKILNLTLEEQLVEVQKEIDKHTEELKALRAKRKDIQDKIADKEKEEVYLEFLKSGKTLDDLKVLLYNQ